MLWCSHDAQGMVQWDAMMQCHQLLVDWARMSYTGTTSERLVQAIIRPGFLRGESRDGNQNNSIEEASPHGKAKHSYSISRGKEIYHKGDFDRDIDQELNLVDLRIGTEICTNTWLLERNGNYAFV
jgi:hypothetical protein